MPIGTLLRASLLLLGLLQLGTAAPLAAQAYRVGTPFQPRLTIGRVDAMVVSPDGRWTVYAGDQRSWGVRELYAIPTDGSGAARRLSGTLVTDGDVQLGTGEELGHQITSDSARVVYRADAAVDEQFELFVASINGQTPPRRLNPSLAAAEDVQEPVLLVPPGVGGGERVLFRVGTSSSTTTLYVAPVDGSAPTRRIDAGTGADVTFFGVSPDGTRFFYIDFSSALFAGPLDGSSAPVWIADGPTAAQFSPDGTRIVFRQFTYTPPVVSFWLASVPSAGGPTSILAPAPFDFAMTQDSAHVIFRRGGETNLQLACVPLAGGTVHPLSASNGHVIEYRLTAAGELVFRGTQPAGQGLYRVSLPAGTAERISHDLAPSTGVYDFELSPDGSAALYSAGSSTPRTLYSVALTGNPNPLVLADAVQADYRFTPDGASAVYRADATSSLYRRPIDGASAAVRLDDSEPRVPALSFALDPSGARAVYRRQTDAPDGSPVDLLSVRCDGGDTQQLNLPLPTVALGSVERFRTTDDGERCVYLADAELQDTLELWSSSTRPGSHSTRLNGSLPASGDVQSDFVLTSDGGRVLFRADGEVDERFDLFVAPIDGLAPPLALTSAFAPDLDVDSGLLLDPTEQFVVFRASTGGSDDLYIACLDGATAPERRNDDTDTAVGAGVRFAGDFLLYLGRRPGSSRFDLCRVPFDGSAAPVRLNSPPVFGGGIPAGASSFLVTPDGERALYLSAQTDFTRFDLYGVPVDLSSAPVRLSAPFASNTSITSFQVDAGGTHVFYETVTSTSNGPADYRLYSAPIDGSLAAIELTRNPTQPTGFVPSGSVVIFRTQERLAVAPADGSAAPLALTPSLPNLREFVLSPDGTFVLYARGYPYPGITQLERVPTRGGEPPTPVVGPLPAGQQVLADFAVTPDSRRIVFRGLLGARRGLFSKNLDGSETDAWLDGGISLQVDVDAFEIAEDSRRVLFLRGSSEYELFASPIHPRPHAPSSGPR